MKYTAPNAAILAALLSFLSLASLASLAPQEKPIAGLIPKAQKPITMDGKLDDWTGAFITPLNATHPDFANRATLIYYLWSDQALYIGLRALDANPTHLANDNALYDGDAIEFYLDTREGGALGNPEFQPRTLHMFFTALTGKELKPRFNVRSLPVFDNLKLKGVELAAQKTPDGYTLEFKLPWSNFPGFTPKAGTPIGMDVEMCSADGGKRVHRTFAYSSPESVQTPSAFGRVQLVESLDPAALVNYSRVLMAMDAQLPGNYGWLHAVACISPTVAGSIKQYGARLVEADGRVRKSGGNIRVKTVAGHWPMLHCEIETFDVKPGTYTLLVTGFTPNGGAVVERMLKITLPAHPEGTKGN